MDPIFDKFSIQKILEIGSFEGQSACYFSKKLSKGQIHCLDTWKGDDDLREKNIDFKIIEKNFNFLATVGATAPFIGLFGTVWGIMNSFQSIAISRNTSLAIVAPGIAEALFATALGLLAAIPAVVAYNKFNSDSKKYSQKLENFSKRFTSII